MEQKAILLVIFIYYFLFIAALFDIPEDISAMKFAVRRKNYRKENNNQDKEE